MAAAAVIPFDELSELEVVERRSLESHAKKIIPYLHQDDVNDVVVNDNGMMWIKRHGAGWEQVDHIPSKITRLILRSVATMHGTTLNHEHPFLETTFPLDGSRIEGIIPPVVKNAVLAIRIRPRKIYTFEDYESSGILTNRVENLTQVARIDQFRSFVSAPHSHREVIEAAIKFHQNILIVGSTGSGKTTLVNAAIHAIGDFTKDDRLVIIEDTPELQSAIPNSVFLLATSKISLTDCLVASLRLNPDRILVGEVRRKKPARVLLESWNTGHAGGIATIHADNALKGLYRLEEVMDRKSARNEVARSVNLVVHIDSDPSITARRKLREVIIVNGLKGNEYDVTYI